MNFQELNLLADVQSGIDQMGYTELTPIQEQAMPILLQGQDLAGLSQTGTGKTAAFLIPLIERVMRSFQAEDSDLKKTRYFPDWKPFHTILVLGPTRELVEQTQENFKKLSKGTPLKSAMLFGGVSYEKQKDDLSKKPEFIIATPGRLIDLYKDQHLDFKQVRAVMFDEADRLFDMGFKDDMKYILQRIPQERQLILFSATLNLEVMNVAYSFGSQPVEINVSRDQAKAENVKDYVFHVGDKEKAQHLLSLLKKQPAKQVIVFTNYKNQVNQMTQFLLSNGFPAVGISSLLSQAQRLNVMQKFKSENEHNYLIATDVAARGLDIQGVDMVINFEVPQDPETYVHRIGRTGRAGREGIAYSLASDRDVESLARIEELTKKKIEISYLEDSVLVKDFKPFPSSDRDPYFKSSQGAKDLSPWAKKQNPRSGPRGSGPQERGPSDEQGRPARNNGPRKDQPRRNDRPQSEGAQGAAPRGPRNNSANPSPRGGAPNEGARSGRMNGQGDVRRQDGAQSNANGSRGPRPTEAQNKMRSNPRRNSTSKIYSPRAGAPAAAQKPNLVAKVKNFLGKLFN